MPAGGPTRSSPVISCFSNRATQKVTAEFVRLSWQFGDRTRPDILAETRDGCGAQAVCTLPSQLTTEYGAGLQVEYNEPHPQGQIAKVGLRLRHRAAHLLPTRYLV